MSNAEKKATLGPLLFKRNTQQNSTFQTAGVSDSTGQDGFTQGTRSSQINKNFQNHVFKTMYD